MGERYKVIVADCPWSYRNGTLDTSAAQQYPTMSTDDICKLPVAGVASPNSVMLFWATWPCMLDAFRVIKAWGFEYVTGLPWIKLDKCERDLWGEWHMKTQVGMGFWVRGVSEPILICRRGDPPLPKNGFVGLLSPNIRHSMKPDSIYEYAEQFPGPYLELFARRRRAGWHCFGNEVESDVKL